jgi:hypothetical protein
MLRPLLRCRHFASAAGMDPAVASAAAIVQNEFQQASAELRDTFGSAEVWLRSFKSHGESRLLVAAANESLQQPEAK